MEAKDLAVDLNAQKAVMTAAKARTADKFAAKDDVAARVELKLAA